MKIHTDERAAPRFRSAPSRLPIARVVRGPLDLLLHLIRKNEVNIHDIPIVLITQQYLSAVMQS
jgi:hypothetical protein